MSTKAGTMMSQVKKDVKKRVVQKEGAIMLDNFGKQMKKRVL